MDLASFSRHFPSKSQYLYTIFLASSNRFVPVRVMSVRAASGSRRFRFLSVPVLVMSFLPIPVRVASFLKAWLDTYF